MQKLKSTEQQQHTCGRFITITAEAVLTGAVVIEDVVVEPGVSGTVTITARIDLHSTENLTNIKLQNCCWLRLSNAYCSCDWVRLSLRNF